MGVSKKKIEDPSERLVRALGDLNKKTLFSRDDVILMATNLGLAYKELLQAEKDKADMYRRQLGGVTSGASRNKKKQAEMKEHIRFIESQLEKHGLLWILDEVE